MVTSGSRGDTTWFPDLPAWPAPDTDPTADIALLLESEALTDLRFQSITSTASPVSNSPTEDDWWNGTPAPAPSSDLFTSIPNAASPSTRRKPLVLAGSAVAVLAVVGVVVAALFAGSGDEAATEAVSPPSASIAPSAASPDDCEPSVTATRTIGNGPGNQDSGPGAILAFNYGYYVKRDARAARAVTWENATQDAPAMQKFIDSVPKGTQHCLTIDDRGNGLYALKITVFEPGALAPKVIPQLIRTAEIEGKIWIVEVAKDTGDPT